MPGDKRGLARLRALYHREPWWAEVFAALACLLWAGASVVSHADLADRPALAIALALAPGWAWETSGLGLGSAQLVALYADNRRARRLLCFAATWWWCFLFLVIVRMDPHAPSAALYLPPLASSALSVLRLRPEPGDDR